MNEERKLNEQMTEISLEEMSRIAGGADYSYAYQIIGEIRVRFKALIASGKSPEDARRQVKNEYWNKVIDICHKHPGACGPEKQAQVIFMFVIGS